MWESKGIVVGREGLAPQVEVERNGQIIEVVSSFKCLGFCFSKMMRKLEWVKE